MGIYSKALWSVYRLLIYCGLYVSIMTMGLMYTSYGLTPFGVTGAFLLVASTVEIGVVLDLFNRRKKTKASRWLYFTGFLTFLSIICFLLLANVQNYITDYRAERIIKGLEEFKAEKGYYPPNLKVELLHLTGGFR